MSKRVRGSAEESFAWGTFWLAITGVILITLACMGYFGSPGKKDLKTPSPTISITAGFQSEIQE